MRRALILAAAMLPLLASLGPSPADARAGGGHSMGSRGSRTYHVPRQTEIAPSIAPFERSQAPNRAINRPAFGQGRFANRHPFATGLLGGFLGAGLFGLLFGGGFFHFGMGFGGIFGLLLQILIIVLVVRWLMRRFLPQGGLGGAASAPGMPQSAAPAAGFADASQSANPGIAPLQLTAADRQAFAQCLTYVQDAWGAGDLKAIAQVATPEMSGYFNEQASTLARQGLRNYVSDVRIEAMELSEAWSEPGADFATVAMRFSLIDVTRDAAGRVVDGSPDLRALVSEVWTFTRRPGQTWLLSAIQQVN